MEELRSWDRQVVVEPRLGYPDRSIDRSIDRSREDDRRQWTYSRTKNIERSPQREERGDSGREGRRSEEHTQNKPLATIQLTVVSWGA